MHWIKKDTVWTKNFFLIWQGQLISSLGDIIYNIALGFWVYDLTGSTILMGSVMAIAMLPKILILPFSGVAADRLSRKSIIILSDFFRGLLMLVLALVSAFGLAELWIIYIGVMLMSICNAFFGPAMISIIPELVPRSRLMKANSLYSMTATISDILGNAIGGLMYVLVGPPVVFTINGISYIVSAVLEGFIDYKHIRKPFERIHLTQDFKEGLGYIWKVKGLFYMIIIGGLVNLFSDTGIMLTLPYFSDADFLGITKYGIAMGIFQLGAFFGVFFLSSFRIKEKFNFRYFMTAGIVYSGSYIVMMNLNNYFGMLLMFFVAGLCTSIYNIIFTTSIHMNVPGGMLGKVSAIIGTVIGGLTPAGMALGGVIAEYMSVKWVIIYCFLFTGISFGLFGMVGEFVSYINNEHKSKDERQIQKDGIAP